MAQMTANVADIPPQKAYGVRNTSNTPELDTLQTSAVWPGRYPRALRRTRRTNELLDRGHSGLLSLLTLARWAANVIMPRMPPKGFRDGAKTWGSDWPDQVKSGAAKGLSSRGLSDNAWRVSLPEACVKGRKLSRNS